MAYKSADYADKWAKKVFDQFRPSRFVNRINDTNLHNNLKAALAELYMFGADSVPINVPLALSLAKESAENGHPHSHTLLAFAKLTGRGTPIDNQMAISHLQLAAEGGDTAGRLMLSDQFRSGRFAKTNCTIAAQTLLSYAKDAIQFDKGKIFKRHTNDVPFQLFEILFQDYEWKRSQPSELLVDATISHLRLLAQNGDSDSTIRLASLILEEGQQNSTSSEQLFKLLERSSNLGSLSARALLSRFYFSGIFVERDIEKGYQLLQEASEDYFGRFFLAKLKLNELSELSIGFDDYSSSDIDLLSENDFEFVQQKTETTENDFFSVAGKLVDLKQYYNPKEGVAILKELLTLPGAMNEFGRILMLGKHGVEKNITSGLYYLQQAASEGHRFASYSLAHTLLNNSTLAESYPTCYPLELLRLFVLESEYIRSILKEAQKRITVGEFDKALACYEYAALLGSKEGTLNAAYLYENGLLGNSAVFDEEISQNNNYEHVKEELFLPDPLHLKRKNEISSSQSDFRFSRALFYFSTVLKSIEKEDWSISIGRHKIQSFCIDKIGEYYFYGRGLAQDFTKAFDYSSKACKKGNAKGCYRAGLINLLKSSTVDDEIEKTKYLHRASELFDRISIPVMKTVAKSFLFTCQQFKLTSFRKILLQAWKILNAFAEKLENFDHFEDKQYLSNEIAFFESVLPEHQDNRLFVVGSRAPETIFTESQNISRRAILLIIVVISACVFYVLHRIALKARQRNNNVRVHQE